MPSSPSSHDQTDLPYVLTGALKLGILQAILVFAFSAVERYLEGTVETALLALILLAGVGATTLLPGTWTRARTIEGIAGAAGIGLGATVVFLIIDVSLLQPLGTYTNRWLAIGGGSNWWYHPVFWMVGTFLPWMGAFALANQLARRGASSPVGVLATAVVLTAVVGGAGVVAGVPGAAWGLGTMSVAFLPAIVLTVVITGLGARRA